MRHIRSAADEYWRRAPDIPPGRGAEWCPTAHWQASTPLNLAAVRPALPGNEVAAYVNQGRWVVECPDCHGAQLACITDRRFLCNVCANLGAEGRWRRVVWPPNRQAVEAALVLRPEANRNWWPHETVADLLAENAAYLPTRPAGAAVEATTPYLQPVPDPVPYTPSEG